MSADKDYDERRAILGLALGSLPRDEEEKVRAALAMKADDEAKARAESAKQAQKRAKARAVAAAEAPREAMSRAEPKRAPKRATAKPEPPPPTMADCLGYLAQKPTWGAAARTSHRTLHLHLLAKLAHRRGPEGLKNVEKELREFAHAAVVEADLIAGDQNTRSTSDRVQDTVDAFYAVANTRDVNKHHWTRFAEAAETPLKLQPSEIHRPLCTDHQEVLMPDKSYAVRTAVWLWSKREAKDFARWTDPRTWSTDCGLFFKSVVPTGAGPPKTARQFTAEFTETVNVDGRNDLSTKLVFSRSVVYDPPCYALGFNLPDRPLPKGAQILVDCGQVTVREDRNAPPEMRTSLLAEKYIRFADPAYAAWPTVACDLFWTEFAIIMAEGC